MVIEDLKQVVNDNKGKGNSEYFRNLLKEKLQVYVLNFIYTSIYKDIIFTGGTCLRKFYGLERISEDLDFDLEGKDFDFIKFQKGLSDYFIKKIGFKRFSLKFSGKTIFIKLPILRDIGFAGPNDSEILFLRLDFSFKKTKNRQTENKVYAKEGFTFIARCYDFDTLFANKVDAFLNRKYKRGNLQKMSFKGRDAFDLVWMLEEAKKMGIKIGLDGKIKKEILVKAKKIKPNDLYNDLNSFFADTNFVKNFCDNYYSLLSSSL